MNWPFVTRSRHEAVLADRERIRGERDQFAKDRDAHRAAAATAARQFAEADATNRRLEGRLLELGRRLAALAESDPEYAARLESRVARLRTVGARLLAAYTAQKRRADRYASHLDDGDLKAIKAWEAHVQAHDEWKPDEDSEPLIEGGWPRPAHPATELRQALERCQKLQALLDGRGKRVAS